MSGRAHFGPELFEFLAELSWNNNREWFQANKARYQTHVLEPLLAFVADFGERLQEISRHYVADPRARGGSVFRIYRDVRFSNDKSPYKTQAAAHFRHETGKEVHGPGYFINLAPGDVFAGAGMWHPEPATLGKVRDAIAGNPLRWQRLLSENGSETFKLEGESLKRPPKGYDPSHPLIEDLKRKDFLVTAHFDEKVVYSPEFIDRYTDFCSRSAPLMEFLTKAVGLPW